MKEFIIFIASITSILSVFTVVDYMAIPNWKPVPIKYTLDCPTTDVWELVHGRISNNPACEITLCAIELENKYVNCNREIQNIVHRHCERNTCSSIWSRRKFNGAYAFYYKPHNTLPLILEMYFMAFLIILCSYCGFRALYSYVM